MNRLANDPYYPLDLDQVPKQWEAAFVGEVISDIQPGFASGAHNREGFGVPHLRPMNIDRAGHIDLSVVKYVSPDNRQRLQGGDVLFNNTNSPELVGKTASIEWDADWAFSNHMTRLRPPRDIVPGFLAYQLHLLWMTGYFRHRCTHHVNQASVSSETLARTVPVLVAPLLEQRRIVAEVEKHLTRLDAAVAALERIRANLKRYRASVLKAACEGRLVSTEATLARAEGREYEPADCFLSRILKERRARWEAAQLVKMQADGKVPQDDRWKGKYEEPAAPDTAGLPELPEGWCWAMLPQLGALNRGKSKHRPRNDPKLLGGPYPFIQTGDVKHSRGLIRTHSQTYSDFGLAQSRLWPTGTLCVPVYRMRESGQEAAAWPSLRPG